MSQSPARHSVDDIVRRLRRAGCVFAEREAGLLADAAGSDGARLDELTARRESGEPLEHVLGWAEFCGVRFAVRPGVFVPRHRSEALVDAVVADRTPSSKRLTLVDLCCGTGALGATIARRLGPHRVELHAADLDPDAIACAVENLAADDLRALTWRASAGDLFEALDPGLRARVDAIVANVPYVPSGEVAILPPEARDHEAPATLDGGTNGLAVLARVAADAHRWLAHGGAVFFELAPHQVDAAAALLRSNDLVPITAPVADDDGTVVLSGRR